MVIADDDQGTIKVADDDHKTVQTIVASALSLRKSEPYFETDMELTVLKM
jgi:hypothetical protein